MVSLILLAFQSKTLNYDIYRDETKIGWAKILTKVTQDGGKRSDAKIEYTVNGKKLDLHSTQVWAFSGKPILKINQMFDEKGVEVNRSRMDFKSTEVVITNTVKNVVTKKTVPTDPKAEIRDFAEFWFLRDEPEQGKAMKYLTFDSSALAWTPTTSTYLGAETKDGTTLHHISQQIGKRKLEIWLDSDGFAVRTESSDHTKIVATK